MSYWNDIGELLKKAGSLTADEVKKGADMIYGSVKNGINTTAENVNMTLLKVPEEIVKKTKESVKLAKLKKDLYFKHIDYRNTLADLGNVSYEISKSNSRNIKQDKEFNNLIQKTKKIEKECLEIEKEVYAIGH